MSTAPTPAPAAAPPPTPAAEAEAAAPPQPTELTPDELLKIAEEQAAMSKKLADENAELMKQLGETKKRVAEFEAASTPDAKRPAPAAPAATAPVRSNTDAMKEILAETMSALMEDQNDAKKIDEVAGWVASAPPHIALQFQQWGQKAVTASRSAVIRADTAQQELRRMAENRLAADTGARHSALRSLVGAAARSDAGPLAPLAPQRASAPIKTEPVAAPQPRAAHTFDPSFLSSSLQRGEAISRANAAAIKSEGSKVVDPNSWNTPIDDAMTQRMAALQSATATLRGLSAGQKSALIAGIAAPK